MPVNPEQIKFIADAITDDPDILAFKEGKKEPSNKPDDLDVEEDFEVHDGYKKDKKKPEDKTDVRLGKDAGPEGEKGSKKSPYLK